MNMDKPKTKYADLSSEIQDFLSSKHSIKNEEDWERLGDKLCCLCGGESANHLLNRCVKAWASTAHARRVLGEVRAAARVRQLLPKGDAVNGVNMADVAATMAACEDCETDEGEARIADGLSFVHDHYTAQPNGDGCISDATASAIMALHDTMLQQ